jgi:hypothetical protein
MMGLAVIGFAISAATLNTAARYISCFLFASGSSLLSTPVHKLGTNAQYYRCLLCQLRHPRMGIRHTWPDSREKSSVTIHSERGLYG